MNSPKFDQFLEEFMEAYGVKEDTVLEAAYYFLNETNPKIDSLELVANKDAVAYDSYGYENSKLQRVYRHKELDILISFEGTRCSYEGEDWTSIKEVIEKTKTVIVYE